MNKNELPLTSIIAPQFYDIHKNIRDSKYSSYWLKGGRGSLKSSFAALQIIIGMVNDEQANALVLRQTAASIRDSVHSTLLWAIDMLGWSEYFESKFSPPEIIFTPTGQKVLMRGLDEPRKLKSIRARKGYIKYLWFEEGEEYNSPEAIRSVKQTVFRGGDSYVEFFSFNPPINPNHWVNKAILEDDTRRMVHTSCYLDVKEEWLGNEFFLIANQLKKNNYDAYRHEYLGEPVGNPAEVVFSGKYRVEEFSTPALGDIYQNRIFQGADWGFACLEGDTLVKTNKGEKPIKDIKVGDLVLTREGYQAVTMFMNKGVKEVYELDCGLETPMIVTGDHRIFTEAGWKEVDQLKSRETLCIIKSSLTAKFIKNILKVRFLTIGIKSVAERIKKHVSCTGIFGRRLTVQFQKAWLFIILMKIKIITILQTLFAYLHHSTQKHITPKLSGVYQRAGCQKYAKYMDIRKKTGMQGALNHLRRLESALSPVLNVIKKLLSLTYIKNFAILIVERNQMLERARKSMFASFAILHSWLHRMTQERLVLKNVPISLRLLKEKTEVFDITVENGEFFANDVLVHNCDPTCLIQCFIMGDSLYIEYESYGYKTELDDIPALFNIIPDAKRWAIKADCSRPETISHVRRKGGFNLSGAPKWENSIIDGIEYLKAFKEIVIHPRCTNLIQEFDNYSYKVDKNTREVLPVLRDSWNHGIDALRYALSSYIKKNISAVDYV